jgi:hypothetical protein
MPAVKFNNIDRCFHRQSIALIILNKWPVINCVIYFGIDFSRVKACDYKLIAEQNCTVICVVSKG